MIEARKASLQRDLEAAVTRMQALHGAIQDCEFWLSVVMKEEAAAKGPTPDVQVPEG